MKAVLMKSFIIVEAQVLLDISESTVKFMAFLIASVDFTASGPDDVKENF